MLAILFAAFVVQAAELSPQALINQAIQAHSSAQTYEEWHDGDFGPENLADTLATKNQDEVCRALEQTPTVDLFHVAEYLEANSEVTCLNKQLARYQHYLQAFTNLSRSMTTAQSVFEPDETLGPSIEYKVNAEKMPTLIDGDLPHKVLNLTFDDGPHATQTLKLLEILREEDLQVNFFLVGRNTTLYPDVVRAQHKDGHEIGCHSFTHPDMRKLSLSKAVAEIEDGFAAIEKALGIPGTFFRFPYGAKTNDLRNYLINTKTPEFFWNIDTLDWKYKDPDVLLKYALEQVRMEQHGIVLFHDIQPQTLAIMPAFLAQLKKEKYRFAIFRPDETRIPSKP